MENNAGSNNRMSVEEAAPLFGMSSNSLRRAMQQGIGGFGFVDRNRRGGCNYIIIRPIVEAMLEGRLAFPPGLSKAVDFLDDY